MRGTVSMKSARPPRSRTVICLIPVSSVVRPFARSAEVGPRSSSSKTCWASQGLTARPTGNGNPRSRKKTWDRDDAEAVATGGSPAYTTPVGRTPQPASSGSVSRPATRRLTRESTR